MSRNKSRIASHPHSLVLLLCKNSFGAWLVAPGSAPRTLRVQGQERLPIENKEALSAACADVAERLRGEGTDLAQIHHLADTLGWRLFCATDLQEAFPGSPPSQILSLEWLARRFGLGDTPLWEAQDWLSTELIPWLVTPDNASEREQMQSSLVREHRSESERLAAERVELQQENERLHAQNSALQTVDAERLLRFLPALFPRVFTVLGATDLALLCGRIEPLPIPNPYPEPSEETLRILQKDFRALPRERQRQIVGFVARLPQRQKLQVRHEMRELVHELEEV